jgi:hypothetical protein
MPAVTVELQSGERICATRFFFGEGLLLPAKQRSAPPKKNHGPASRRPRPSAESAPLSQPLYCLSTRPTSPPYPAPQLLSPPSPPPSPDPLACDLQLASVAVSAARRFSFLLLWRRFIYSKAQEHLMQYFQIADGVNIAHQSETGRQRAVLTHFCCALPPRWRFAHVGKKRHAPLDHHSGETARHHQGLRSASV